MHLADAKEQLRQAMKERLERMSETDKRQESQSVCTNLKRATETATTICAYYPLHTEPDIRPFLEHCLQAGKQVYLPAFQNALVFRRVTSLAELTKGALNILEPPKQAEEPQGVPDVVIVPGRAFDVAGNRLGRGAGGYDIWLRSIRNTQYQIPNTQDVSTQVAGRSLLAIGVCFECQLVHKVPMETHDQRMDAVITARGLTNVSS